MLRVLFISLFFFSLISQSLAQKYDSILDAWKLNAFNQTIQILEEGGEILNEEQQGGIRMYVNCIYSKLTKEDISLVVNKDKTLPYLLNVKYAPKQNECYETAFNLPYEPEPYSKAWHETFYLSRVITYYSKINEIRVNNINRSVSCLKAKMSESQLKSIENWHFSQMNSTQILIQEGYLESMIRACIK